MWQSSVKHPSAYAQPQRTQWVQEHYPNLRSRKSFFGMMPGEPCHAQLYYRVAIHARALLSAVPTPALKSNASCKHVQYRPKLIEVSPGHLVAEFE